MKRAMVSMLAASLLACDPPVLLLDRTPLDVSDCPPVDVVDPDDFVYHAIDIPRTEDVEPVALLRGADGAFTVLMPESAYRIDRDGVRPVETPEAVPRYAVHDIDTGDIWTIEQSGQVLKNDVLFGSVDIDGASELSAAVSGGDLFIGLFTQFDVEVRRASDRATVLEARSLFGGQFTKLPDDDLLLPRSQYDVRIGTWGYENIPLGDPPVRRRGHPELGLIRIEGNEWCTTAGDGNEPVCWQTFRNGELTHIRSFGSGFVLVHFGRDLVWAGPAGEVEILDFYFSGLHLVDGFRDGLAVVARLARGYNLRLYWLARKSCDAYRARTYPASP